jgi:hypothetical protein
MPDEPTRSESILKRHCRVYLAAFRARRASGLHAFYAHRWADTVASREHRITPEERRKRDTEWLDTGWEFKGWREEPEPDKGPSLFDTAPPVG